jgi:hypothetical protein
MTRRYGQKTAYMLNLHLEASMGYGWGISAFIGISSSHPTRRGMIWNWHGVL